jgi:rhomboid protease GluP
MNTAAVAEPHNGKPVPLTELMRARPSSVPVTCALLLINLLVFAAMLIGGAGFWHTANGVPLAWGANFGPATQDGQWWRLVTAMFIHFGILHLSLNMWALWDVGRLVERLYGKWRFGLLYLGSGVVGNLLSLVLQGNQAVSGGASGAIFSLYGALLVFLWRERRQVERGEFRWLFAAASVFTLLMLGMGLLLPGIDNAAHGGGLIAGALLGQALARPWTAQSPRPGYASVLTAALLVLLVGLLVLRLPAPSYRLGEEVRAREAIRQFISEDQRISQQWDAIMDAGRQGTLSFDQAAGRLESGVTAAYQHSFEALTAVSPSATAPSARTLESLQSYASVRASAAQNLADGLRARDQEKVRQAIAQARQAPSLATQPAVPASAPSSSAR